MFTLGSRSRKNLHGVHPKLVSIVERAIVLTTVDFVVIDGVRSRARQKENVERGVSWTMNSKHLPQIDGYGHAVDLAAWVEGAVAWGPWSLYEAIYEAMSAAAKENETPIVWGGNWKQKDGVHFELNIL